MNTEVKNKVQIIEMIESLLSKKTPSVSIMDADTKSAFRSGSIDASTALAKSSLWIAYNLSDEEYDELLDNEDIVSRFQVVLADELGNEYQAQYNRLKPSGIVEYSDKQTGEIKSFEAKASVNFLFTRSTLKALGLTVKSISHS